MKVNNDYRIFMSIYIGSATGTRTSEVRCDKMSDGTPVFQDFRLNGPIIIEPSPEESEPEIVTHEESEYYYSESESSSTESSTESEGESEDESKAEAELVQA